MTPKNISETLKSFDKKFWWKYESGNFENTNKFSLSECSEIKLFLKETITELLEGLRMELPILENVEDITEDYSGGLKEGQYLGSHQAISEQNKKIDDFLA